MQHVDQHMDDLFRNAAENYQLKAMQDWDKIAPYLSGQAPAPAAAVKPTNKKLWLILVVSLVLSPLLIIDFDKDKSVSIVRPATEDVTKERNVKPENQTEHKTSKQITKEFSISGIREVSQYKSTEPERITPIELDSRQRIIKTIPDPAVTEAALPVSQQDRWTIKLQPLNLSMQTVERGNKKDIGTPSKINTDPRQLTNTDVDLIASIPVKKTPESRGFYLGIMAGPQWNQVEGQGYNKTGLNLGLIGGYSFNRKMAVESGISYSRKYYYSDGQYFHMKKKPGTPTMEVISLEGSSNVIEIPLKVKYDVINRKKGELFVTAGISTYILTKENNQYYALINGSPQNSNVIYTDKKTYLAGGLNLSAGYSIHLKKKTDIRIEPYMQMPFKGTGVGSMRVTTAGLNIGITRALR